MFVHLICLYKAKQIRKFMLTDHETNINESFSLQKPFHGLSGKLSFSEDGTRNDYVFLVYAMVLDKGPKKVINDNSAMCFNEDLK